MSTPKVAVVLDWGDGRLQGFFGMPTQIDVHQDVMPISSWFDSSVSHIPDGLPRVELSMLAEHWVTTEGSLDDYWASSTKGWQPKQDAALPAATKELPSET